MNMGAVPRSVALGETIADSAVGRTQIHRSVAEAVRRSSSNPSSES